MTNPHSPVRIPFNTRMFIEGVLFLFVLLLIAILSFKSKDIVIGTVIITCVNFGEAICPEDIREQAICIDGDIGIVIDELRK